MSDEFTARVYQHEKDKTPTFILAALLMVTLLHTLSAVAFVQAEFILNTLRIVIFGVFTWSTGSSMLKREEQALLDQVPMDIRTVFARLALNPDIVEFAACPSCLAIYAPDTSRPHDA